MNIQRWKGTVWLGSLAVGGFLSYYVYDFLKHREELAKEIPDAELARVLDSVQVPEEEKTDVVEYAKVQHVFHDHDWTGKPKEKPVDAKGPVEPPTIPKVPVAELLKVLAIKVDTSKPENSVAHVKFEGKLSGHTAKDDVRLKIEERLFTPYEDIRVEAITPGGVVFAFDDAARDKETVPTLPYQSAQRGELGIVVVGPEGLIEPQLQRQIDEAAPVPWNPEQTIPIRKNEYQVGTETLAELDRDYSRILSRDIGTSTYKDPKTGRTDGIKINHVAPNSIPAQAGLTEGEVLKSINGHKVTSVNDAIAYVKANANATDTWTCVFEKQGREFTRIYHSPND